MTGGTAGASDEGNISVSQNRGTERSGTNIVEDRERFPIPGNEAGRVQAEVSGPSVPVRGASSRMMSLSKEKPIHCSSVSPLGIICKCRRQPVLLIFQVERWLSHTGKCADPFLSRR